MRRIIFLLLVTFLFLPREASAQMLFTQPATPSAARTVSVDYTLPYPGILPTNPLYLFKAIRDGIISRIISNPIKKAEFDLLQADKRLEMGVALVNMDKKNIPLAFSTISKGQNYFSDAITQVKIGRKEGLVTSDILGRLFLSSQKHEEVLTHLLNSLSKKDKESGEFLLIHIGELKKQVNDLQKESKNK